MQPIASSSARLGSTGPSLAHARSEDEHEDDELRQVAEAQQAQQQAQQQQQAQGARSAPSQVGAPHAEHAGAHTRVRLALGAASGWVEVELQLESRPPTSGANTARSGANTTRLRDSDSHPPRAVSPPPRATPSPEERERLSPRPGVEPFVSSLILGAPAAAAAAAAAMPPRPPTPEVRKFGAEDAARQRAEREAARLQWVRARRKASLVGVGVRQLLHEGRDAP